MRLLNNFSWRRCIVLCSALLVSSILFAVSPDSLDERSDQRIEYLEQEKNQLSEEISQAQQAPVAGDLESIGQQIRKNEIMQSFMRAKIVNLEGLSAYHDEKKDKLTLRLKKLQQSLSSKTDAVVTQEQISKINASLETNKKILELMTSNLELAKKYYKILLADRHKLQVSQAEMDERRQIHAINQEIAGLNRDQRRYYQANLALQQKKSLGDRLDSVVEDESRLVLNNQMIFLLQNQTTKLELQKKLIKTEVRLLESEDFKTLQSVMNLYKEVSDRYTGLIQSLNTMSSMLQNERAMTQIDALKPEFDRLRALIAKQLSDLTVQNKVLQDKIEVKQQVLKKLIASRQSLSTYHFEHWPEIFEQILSMPNEFYHYIKGLAIKVQANLVWEKSLFVFFFWSILFAIFLIALTANYLLNQMTESKSRARLSAHLYDGALTLLSRNVPHLAFMVMIVTIFSLNHVPYANYRLLFKLLIVWLTFRNLILIARLTLLERISDASGRDVRLYYRLKWLFLAGGWSTALMVFSHRLPLPLLLQDIFNRIFMLFLLAIAMVIWKSKDVIPHLMRPFLKAKKKYIRNAIKLLVILIPFTLMTTAIIGLLGYIELAWAMSRYQVDFLLVLTGYVLIRGVVFDLLEVLSEWMISSLKNGWLWIEVFLKPLDKLLRVFLLFLSVLILFQLFGWYSDSWVVTYLSTWAIYPLINLSGVHITLLSMVQFVILLFIFIWAARWTREFCYRWLYRHARDAGIRNSLSVFTQYGVILIGTFITLRVLGLDFSGMSMVLGGLAVGMGFGLRDFASNIIGGIMLLIERPVREGDLITLGEYEGRVAHIGIRSMRVSSWDNMEVLIPNAETFNKPFTNWTHQDNIVRTVIPIKVNRMDDPIMVQQLILDVLTIIPEILTEPASQVFLKQIDDALIEFEVRYYINVELHTRFEVRSKALFAITAQFKAAGVKPPIPPLSVELKEPESEQISTPPPLIEKRT